MALQPRRHRLHCRKFLFTMLRRRPRSLRSLLLRRDKGNPRIVQLGSQKPLRPPHPSRWNRPIRPRSDNKNRRHALCKRFPLQTHELRDPSSASHILPLPRKCLRALCPKTNIPPSFLSFSPLRQQTIHRALLRCWFFRFPHRSQCRGAMY